MKCILGRIQKWLLTIFQLSSSFIQQKMQQIPSTYPPFSFHGNPLHMKSLVQAPTAMKYTESTVNLAKKQQILSEDHSFKKRLQIFKQYQPKFNTVSENDDTVVYQKRKRVVDSDESRDKNLPAHQRQHQYGRKLNRYNSGCDMAETNNKKRQKIFSIFKPTRSPNYQLSFKSMKESHEESLITTQRLRKNIDTILPLTQQSQPKGFSLFSAKIENQPLNVLNNMYSRNASIQKLKFEGQVINSLASLSQQRNQIQANYIVSPKKITFTYQNSNSFVGIQPLPVPTASRPSLFQSQTLVSKKVSKADSPPLPSTFGQRHNTTYKDSTVPFKGRLTFQKKTVGFIQRPSKDRTKTTQTNKLPSWGSKIRAQLMGQKHLFQDKALKQKEFGSSKISLNLVKQSLIINGEKINRENLKINESLSNISDGQSSKRYFDEQMDILPQVKKISYGNIDISREESLPEHYEQFKPNQLLLQFQTQKFQPHKNEEILQIFDVSPVQKPKKKKEQLILEKNILQELSQEIKSEQIVKQVNRTGKLFPVLLILLATMLFVIQALV